MSRWPVIIIVVLAIVVALGLLLPSIQKARLNANLVTTRKNMSELGLFADNHVNPKPEREGGRLLNHVPAGTVVLPGVAPEERLSWVVPILPGLDQKRQDIGALLSQINDTQPWAAEANQQAARTRLV